MQSDRSHDAAPSAQRVVVFIALVASALLLIPFSPYMPAPGLDPSWAYALNVAVEKGFVFGRDLIFTFGPLGSVYSGVYSPDTDTIMMVGSTLYAVGFAISLYFSAPTRRQWWVLVLPVVVCLFVLRDALFVSMPFFLLLSVLRATQSVDGACRLAPTRGVIGGLAIATLALGIGPIIKGSFSGVVLPVGGLTFLLLLICSIPAALGYAAVALIGMVGSWVLSGQSLADLPTFLLAQGPIISGYTNAMSLGGPGGSVAYFLVTAAAVFCIFTGALWKSFGKRAFFPVLAIAFTLFVAFKAGFVRQDNHVFISLGVLLLLTYGVSLYARPRYVVGLWIMVCFVWYAVGSTVYKLDGHFFQQKVLDRVLRTAEGIKNRIVRPEIFSEEYIKAVDEIREKHTLPAVQGKVDLYPTELSAIFANGMDWSGRPVPQSYSVYDPVLNAKNADHLRSSRAPDTVFYAMNAIDGRFPSQEDSGSMLELLAGYSVQGVDSSYALLKRHTGPRTVSLETKSTVSVQGKFGESIALDTTRPVWMRLEIRPTVLGQLVSTVFRLPQVQIEVNLENGISFRKRLIPKMAEAGFIVSPYLESPTDFVNLAAGVDFGLKVKSVKFFTEREGLWQDDIAISMTPILIQPQVSARALIFSAPEPGPDIKKVSSPAQCTIDTISGASVNPAVAAPAGTDGAVRLQGWAAPQHLQDDGSDMQVWAVVKQKDGTTEYYKAKMMARPDVAAYLKRPGLNQSGFTLAMDFSEQFEPAAISLILQAGEKILECPGINISIPGRR